MPKQSHLPPQVDTKPELLTETEAGKRLGFSIRSLQKWRCYGGGPRFIRVSARAIRYRPADLEQWIKDRAKTSTSEYER